MREAEIALRRAQGLVGVTEILPAGADEWYSNTSCLRMLI
jgi:hypothetical protein